MKNRGSGALGTIRHNRVKLYVYYYQDWAQKVGFCERPLSINLRGLGRWNFKKICFLY